MLFIYILHFEIKEKEKQIEKLNISVINGFVKNNIPVHTQRLIDHKQKHWIDNDKQELHF